MKQFMCTLCLLLSTAWIQATDEPVPDIKTESMDLAGNSALLVRSNTKEADIWLDMSFKGSVPVDMNGLKPGKYSLLLQKDGYYDCTIILTLAANTRTTIWVDLLLKTGFIKLSTNVGHAFLQYKNERYDEGLIELPAGRQRVSIRAFGYEDHEEEVFVPLRSTYEMSVILEKALFAASGFSVSSDDFNPRNSGLKGQASFAFSVTAPGFAHLSIRDGAGLLVYEERFGPFDTWEQETSWDGKDMEALQVPDGLYSLALSVEPGPGIETQKDLLTFDGSIRVDSTMIQVPRGMAAVLPGPSLGYGGFVPGINSAQVSGGLLATATGSEVPLFRAVMGASVSLRDSLDASINLQLGTEPGDGIFRAGLRYGLRPSGYFSFGAAVNGTVAFNPLLQASNLLLAFPLTFGTRFMHVTLSPVLGSYWNPAWTWRLEGSTALVLANYSTSAELSLRLVSTNLGTETFAMDMPVLLALDFGYLPPSMPLSFGLHGQLGLDQNSLRSWEAGFYIGAYF